MKLPHLKKPCAQCPFRQDTHKGWLGAERMREILSARSFVCHKDTTQQCAGHMLIKGEKNDFVMLAKRLHINLSLKGRELVFSDEPSCIAHHERLSSPVKSEPQHDQ